jgi:hypothetical protein
LLSGPVCCCWAPAEAGWTGICPLLRPGDHVLTMGRHPIHRRGAELAEQVEGLEGLHAELFPALSQATATISLPLGPHAAPSSSSCPFPAKVYTVEALRWAAALVAAQGGCESLLLPA